jgi:hypothetical protein
MAPGSQWRRGRGAAATGQEACFLNLTRLRAMKSSAFDSPQVYGDYRNPNDDQLDHRSPERLGDDNATPRCPCSYGGLGGTVSLVRRGALGQIQASLGVPMWLNHQSTTAGPPNRASPSSPTAIFQLKVTWRCHQHHRCHTADEQRGRLAAGDRLKRHPGFVVRLRQRRERGAVFDLCFH